MLYLAIIAWAIILPLYIRREWRNSKSVEAHTRRECWNYTHR